MFCCVCIAGSLIENVQTEYDLSKLLISIPLLKQREKNP